MRESPAPMTTSSSLSAPVKLANGKVQYASGGGLALLTLCNPPANGYSVEMIDESTFAVGARYDDDRASDAGSVYVYRLEVTGNWQMTQKLLPADLGAKDLFGTSLA